MQLPIVNASFIMIDFLCKRLQSYSPGDGLLLLKGLSVKRWHFQCLCIHENNVDNGSISSQSLDSGMLDESADPFGGLEDGVMLDNPDLICYECDDSFLV